MEYYEVASGRKTCHRNWRYEGWTSRALETALTNRVQNADFGGVTIN